MVEVNQIYRLNSHIFILGTMHFDKSLEEILNDFIEKRNIKCLMIELDDERYNDLKEIHQTNNKTDNLLENSTRIEKKSDHQLNKPENLSDLENDAELMDHLYAIQQEMAKALGIAPGIDMFTAIKIAKSKKIPFKLIDMPFSELMNIIQSSGEDIQHEQEELVSKIKEEPPSAEEMKELSEQIMKPEVMAEIMKQFKNEFPRLFNALIEQRNEYMVQNIVKYIKKYPNNNILIITGAAHVSEVSELVRNHFTTENPQ